MALTEPPGGGSDLQIMTTVARPAGDAYVIDGSKTWISNARRAGLIALLCKTDPRAEPAHRGISVLLVEPGAGGGGTHAGPGGPGGGAPPAGGVGAWPPQGADTR